MPEPESALGARPGREAHAGLLLRSVRSRSRCQLDANAVETDRTGW